MPYLYLSERKTMERDWYSDIRILYSTIQLCNKFLSTLSLNILALSPYLETLKEPRNRFQGIYSANLCSLAGQYDKYDKSIPWKQFLGSLNVYKFWLRKLFFIISLWLIPRNVVATKSAAKRSLCKNKESADH
jgi:hypothetical protein